MLGLKVDVTDALQFEGLIVAARDSPKFPRQNPSTAAAALPAAVSFNNLVDTA